MKDVLRRRFVAIALLLWLSTSLLYGAEKPSAQGRWVSAWSTAIHAPLAFPGLPPAPVFEKQTIRMVVKPTIGGERLRVRFSNAFGSSALTIGAAHVALVQQGGRIAPESDRTLLFGGKASITIPPGAPVLSDAVDLKVPAFSEIAVSIYLPVSSSASSTHFWAQHETYVSGPGDSTAQAELPNPTTQTSWYWLADVEVWNSQAAAVVTLGDSITDGVGAKQGEYADWPDLLADRLRADKGGAPVSVVNAGIGGNRILHDGAGVSALARFDRDVLAQPGVAAIMILEGINDIGWPHMKPRLPNGETLKDPPFVHELVSAEDLIVGFKQMIDRAHQHGIRVFGATLTPYGGADYYSEDGEATRQAVNQWIRSSGAFDGVFDFDAAVRDAQRPAQFREGYHSGDHLHPSAIGYKAMADAVDLSLLRTSVKSQARKKQVF
ncbi:MAG: SGNH/GDSL hydrolase family protein [Acidobacteria bacterium]|nr:SGNH/GDSL hydrolase family protein [Acidobacteriota bacterium]